MATAPLIELPPQFQIQCLSLTQPYASLIGIKLIETRGWKTTYRGPLAIHATQDRSWLGICRQEPFASALRELGILHPDDLPLKAIVAVCRLVDCVPIVGPPQDAREAAFGLYMELSPLSRS